MITKIYPNFLRTIVFITLSLLFLVFPAYSFVDNDGISNLFLKVSLKVNPDSSVSIKENFGFYKDGKLPGNKIKRMFLRKNKNGTYLPDEARKDIKVYNNDIRLDTKIIKYNKYYEVKSQMAGVTRANDNKYEYKLENYVESYHDELDEVTWYGTRLSGGVPFKSSLFEILLPVETEIKYFSVVVDGIDITDNYNVYNDGKKLILETNRPFADKELIKFNAKWIRKAIQPWYKLSEEEFPREALIAAYFIFIVTALTIVAVIIRNIVLFRKETV